MKLIRSLISILFIFMICVSFFISNFINDIEYNTKLQHFDNDVIFVSNNIINVWSRPDLHISTIKSINQLIEIETQHDFEIMSSSSVNSGSSSVVLYVELEKNSSDWVVSYTNPYNPILVGFVVNSDKYRSDAIEECLNNGLSFLENIDLADGSGKGRIIFSKFNSNTIIAYVLSYSYMFSDIVSFYDGDIQIYINSVEAYSNSKIKDYYEINTGKISVRVEKFDQPSYSLIFYFFLIMGILISIFIAIIIVMFEIHRTKALEESKFKTSFLAEMSHEIKTPMNGIIGMSEILSEVNKANNDKEQVNYVKTIMSCAKTLNHLIDNMMDITKIESGIKTISPTRVNISKMIENKFNDIWYVFRDIHLSGKDVNTTLNYNGHIPLFISIDHVKFFQVFDNILINAFKFTEHGSIIVNTKFVDMFIIVSISDQGVGIDTEDIKRIFEPFIQIGNHKKGGSGLGLGICKSLCNQLGGSINCSSVKGSGTTFEFKVKYDIVGTDPPILKDSISLDNILHAELPHSRSKSITTQIISPTVTGPTKRPSILIVDDVSVNRVVLYRIMEKYDVDTHFCVDGMDAIQKCENFKFSLIFMDIIMPVLDGIEATKVIRSSGINRLTPIIIISASVHSDSIRVCNDIGADGFLPKPITRSVVFNSMVQNMEKEEVNWCRSFL